MQKEFLHDVVAKRESSGAIRSGWDSPWSTRLPFTAMWNSRIDETTRVIPGTSSGISRNMRIGLNLLDLEREFAGTPRDNLLGAGGNIVAASGVFRGMIIPFEQSVPYMRRTNVYLGMVHEQALLFGNELARMAKMLLLSHSCYPDYNMTAIRTQSSNLEQIEVECSRCLMKIEVQF